MCRSCLIVAVPLVAAVVTMLAGCSGGGTTLATAYFHDCNATSSGTN